MIVHDVEKVDRLVGLIRTTGAVGQICILMFSLAALLADGEDQPPIPRYATASLTF